MRDVFLGVGEWGKGLVQVSGDIGCEHTQEHVGTDPLGQAMKDRTQVEVVDFDDTEVAFDVGDPALAWSQRLEVEVGGAGTVAQAGVVLPRLLADRLGLTTGLAEVVARAGFFPVRHRGRALVDATCALVAGATCLSDVEAMTAQEELFGPGGGVWGFHDVAGARRVSRATRW